MPRRRKKTDLPFWWRASAKCYHVQVDGAQRRLDSDLDTAWRLYHEIMAGGPTAPPTRAAAPTAATPAPASGPLVLDVLETFSTWVRANKAARTYEAYRDRLQHLVDGLKASGDLALPMASLRPIHVTRVVLANPGWSANTKRGVIAACQRATRWAKRQGLIDADPLADMEKPGAEDREAAVSPAQYAEIMAAVVDPAFRALLEFAWESGARPQELVRIEARYVREDERRIVFPVQESKGKKRSRVVYLTDEALAILRPAMAAHPTGPVFRTARGTAWTRYSVKNAFIRLRRRLGRAAMAAAGEPWPRLPRFSPARHAPEALPAARKAHERATAALNKERRRLALARGPELHLGAFRKGYCTEALKNGLDTVTVAGLLGHANAVMVSRVYAKVQQDPAYMAEAAARARGRSAGR